jgi:hypothetical protein
MSSTTAIPCPATQDRVNESGPQGIDRLVMLTGVTMTNWAQRRADRKAMARSSTPLAGLSDHERVQLYREATALRDGAYAELSRYHVIG